MALIVHPAFTHTLAVKPDPPPSHFDALPMDALLHISKFVAAACDHGTLCSLSAVNVRCRRVRSALGRRGRVEERHCVYAFVRTFADRAPPPLPRPMIPCIDVACFSMHVAWQACWQQPGPVAPHVPDSLCGAGELLAAELAAAVQVRGVTVGGCCGSC